MSAVSAGPNLLNASSDAKRAFLSLSQLNRETPFSDIRKLVGLVLGDSNAAGFLPALIAHTRNHSHSPAAGEGLGEKLVASKLLCALALEAGSEDAARILSPLLPLLPTFGSFKALADLIAFADGVAAEGDDSYHPSSLPPSHPLRVLASTVHACFAEQLRLDEVAAKAGEPVSNASKFAPHEKRGSKSFRFRTYHADAIASHLFPGHESASLRRKRYRRLRSSLNAANGHIAEVYFSARDVEPLASDTRRMTAGFRSKCRRAILNQSLKKHGSERYESQDRRALRSAVLGEARRAVEQGDVRSVPTPTDLYVLGRESSRVAESLAEGVDVTDDALMLEATYAKLVDSIVNTAETCYGSIKGLVSTIEGGRELVKEALGIDLDNGSEKAALPPCRICVEATVDDSFLPAVLLAIALRDCEEKRAVSVVEAEASRTAVPAEKEAKKARSHCTAVVGTPMEGTLGGNEVPTQRGGDQPEVFTSSHQAALCVVPPPKLWGVLQSIRQLHDKAFERWPPHINIMFPFVHFDNFQDVAKQCHQALAGVAPFEVVLSAARSFPHGTVWADPTPLSSDKEGAWDDLVSALVALPCLSQFGKGRPSFNPHLTVGRWPKGELHEATASMNDSLAHNEATFTCSHVFLMWREGREDPFSVRCVVPLGGRDGLVTDLDWEYCCHSNTFKDRRNGRVPVFLTACESGQHTDSKNGRPENRGAESGASVGVTEQPTTPPPRGEADREDGDMLLDGGIDTPPNAALAVSAPPPREVSASRTTILVTNVSSTTEVPIPPLAVARAACPASPLAHTVAHLDRRIRAHATGEHGCDFVSLGRAIAEADPEGKDNVLISTGSSVEGGECALNLRPGSKVSVWRPCRGKLASEAFNTCASRNLIAGAPTDSKGNPVGSEYDLGRDGAYDGCKVVVLQLYTGSNREAFTFAEPKAALESKGFLVVHHRGDPPSSAGLREELADASQLWVISDSTPRLLESHRLAIAEFWDGGGGLYIFGDNNPFFADANALLSDVDSALRGEEAERQKEEGPPLPPLAMSGNWVGSKDVGPMREPKTAGFALCHELTTGIATSLAEGVTVAEISANTAAALGFEEVLREHEGHLVAAFLPAGSGGVARRGPVMVDGAFTKLYCHWQTTGSARFVKNCACLLSTFTRAAREAEVRGQLEGEARRRADENSPGFSVEFFGGTSVGLVGSLVKAWMGDIAERVAEVLGVGEGKEKDHVGLESAAVKVAMPENNTSQRSSEVSEDCKAKEFPSREVNSVEEARTSETKNTSPPPDAALVALLSKLESSNYDLVARAVEHMCEGNDEGGDLDMRAGVHASFRQRSSLQQRTAETLLDQGATAEKLFGAGYPTTIAVMLREAALVRLQDRGRADQPAKKESCGGR